MLGDTILAVASPKGSSARAVLRLSGPDAFEAAAVVFAPPPPRLRAQCDGRIAIEGGELPALLLAMPGPHSYTGEDVVELHVPGSPLLCSAITEAIILAMGVRVRPARPGEFTARACQNGRLDALQAEGVLLLIHGQDRQATAAGASWLLGGLSATIARIRGLLQDALALVEVGFDFDPAEAGAVAASEWREPLRTAERELAALLRAMPMTAPGGEVLLLGRSNAGKSSLCNALAGRDAVLVDGTPGTTRDLLRVPIGGDAAVWDAPGDLADPGELDRAALALRDRLGDAAGAALLVVDPEPIATPQSAAPVPLLAVVFTKADAVAVPAELAATVRRSRAALELPAELPQFVVSSRTGAGIADLRQFLQRHSGIGPRDLGVPVRTALLAAAAALARATAGGVEPELVSVDVQQALTHLGEVSGSHGIDDLLDRIYGRFCLGK